LRHAAKVQEGANQRASLARFAFFGYPLPPVIFGTMVVALLALLLISSPMQAFGAAITACESLVY
jgi:hypothetical protein